MPWWEALISAGGNQTNSVEQALYNINQSEVAWKRSIGADSTKHQREVADLKAAGLNPILSAGNAGGAPTAQPAAGFQTHDVSSAVRARQERDRITMEQKRLENETAVAGSTVLEKTENANLARAAASAKAAEEFRTWAEAWRSDFGLALDKSLKALHDASAEKARVEAGVKTPLGKVGKAAGEIVDELVDFFKSDAKSAKADPTNWFFGPWLGEKVKSGYRGAADFFRTGDGNANGGANSAKEMERRKEQIWRNTDKR